MVRLILEYGNCVRGPVYCGDQDKVEHVQRQATKIVASVRNLAYQEQLKRLRLPSMHYRRERERQYDYGVSDSNWKDQNQVQPCQDLPESTA